MTLRARLGDASQLALAALLALSVSGCFQNAYDVQCVANDATVELAWTAESGLDRYRVYRVTAGGELAPVGEAQGTSWVDTAVDPGVEYHYVVRPVGADGVDTAGTGQCSVTAAGAPAGPEVVADLTCRAKSGKVDLLWQPVADAVSYRVLRAPAASDFSQLGEIASPPYTDLTVLDGNQYEYSIVSVAANGATSAQSTSCSAAPGPNGGGDPPPAVADLSCRGKRDKVDLSWTAVSGAAFYRVFRDVAGVTTPLGEVIDAVAVDFGVTPSAVHQYVVRAVAADGTESADSAACTYSATDRDGGNRAPTITSAPVTNALERFVYRYEVVATDPDGQPVTLSTAQAPPGMYFEPGTQTLLWVPVADQIGPHVVELRATDAAGAFGTQAFVVTAADFDEPPRITSVPVLRAQVGDAYLYDVEGFDPEGGTLTFSFAEPPPTGMTIDSATGVIRWTPAAALLGRSVAVRVSDPSGGFGDQSYTLDATQEPLVLAAPDGEFQVEVGSTLELRFQSNYPNARYAAFPLPANATQQGDVVRFEPKSGQAGRYELIAKGFLNGLVDSNRVVITVIDPNGPPAFGALGPFEVEEGGTLRVAAAATDPDGDALAYTAPGLALENAFFDEFAGELVFQPSFEQAGSYEVLLEASDGVAAVQTRVAITVTDAEAPVGDLALVVNPPQSPTFVRSQTISGSIVGEVVAVTAAAAPLVTGLAPTNVQQGRPATIAVTGRNTSFAQGETSATFGDGVSVDSVTVTSPTAATVHVSVSPTAAVGIRQMRMRSGGQEIPSVVAFRIEEGAAIVRGILRDEFTGQPIAGVRVTVNGTDASAVTNADGSFEIVGVPPGAQRLVAVAPNFEVLDFEIVAEENATYELPEPIGLQALARPAQPAGSLPRAQTLASIIDRGVTSTEQPLSQEQAEQLVSDTMIAVGVDQLGVIDASGGQLNPRIEGEGLLSLTPRSVSYFAEKLRSGEVYTLRQLAFALDGSFGWVFEGLDADTLVVRLQRSVNVAWENSSDPDYALAIALFNPGGTTLSTAPPVLSPDTRFNAFQAFLFVSSFMVRHLGALDMAFDQKLIDRGIDPRELIQEAGIDADRYAALAPHERPDGGAVTRLAARAAGWAGLAGNLAFGGPAHAQGSGGGQQQQGFGGLSGGVINVFSWSSMRSALISGVAGVVLAGGIVLALAACGIAGPLAAFSVLGTFLAGALVTLLAKFIGGFLENKDLPQNLAPRPPAVISQVDPTLESADFYLRFRRSPNDLESDRLRRANPDLGPNWVPDFSGWYQDAWHYLDGTVDKRLLDHRYVLWKFPCNPDEPRCRNLQLDSIAGRQPFSRQTSLAPLSRAEIDSEPLLENVPGLTDPTHAHGGEFEQFRIAKKDLDEGSNYFRIQTIQFYRRIWTLDRDPDRDIWVTKEEVGIPFPPPEFTDATLRGETFRGNVIGELGRLFAEIPSSFPNSVAAGKVAQLEEQRNLALQRSAAARGHRLAFTLEGEKYLEASPQRLEREAQAVLADLKARIEPVKPNIQLHGDIGAIASDAIGREGVSTRTAAEVQAGLLDPSTATGQRLNALLDASPPNARFAFTRYVQAQVAQQRIHNAIALHNDALLELQRLRLAVAAQSGGDPSARVRFAQRPLPGRLEVEGFDVGRANAPREILISSADTAAEARALIDAEIEFQQRQLRRLNGITGDVTHPLNVETRGRIDSFQRTYYDRLQWNEQMLELELAERRLKTAQEVVQIQRDVKHRADQRAQIQVRGFDPSAPKGFAGVQEGLQSRAVLREVNSGWGGVKASMALDVGAAVGIVAEVGGEIHALRDDIDVLQSDLSSTILVTAQNAGPDPVTGVERIDVTSTPSVQASAFGEPIPIASRYGESPEPELPLVAHGLARGALARLFARPFAIDDAGRSVTGAPRLSAVRRAQFVGPGGLPIQFETDPDMDQMLAVLYPAGPPADNPRDGYLFRDFPFSPPEAERFGAGFPSELIAVDSRGRVYLQNFNSNEQFGGRIFRYEGMPPVREHVGSVNYFSQTLMYANPAFPIAMEIGDARDGQGERVEDLFIANRDLGVYFDSGRQPVNRVLRLALHQLEQLPFYANGQNRNRLVAQPWAEHPDFRFEGPTDIEVDARDPELFATRERPLYMSDLDTLYALRDADDDGTAEVIPIAKIPGRVFSGIASDQNGNLLVADHASGEVHLIPQALLDSIVVGGAPITTLEDLDERAFLIKVDLDRPGDVELDSFEHRYIVSTPGGLVPFDIPAVGRLSPGVAEMRVDALGIELPVQIRSRGNLFEVGANSEGTFAGKILRFRIRRVDPDTGESEWVARSVRTQMFGATVLRDGALTEQD